MSGNLTCSGLRGAVRLSVAAGIRRFRGSPAGRRGFRPVLRSSLFRDGAGSHLSIMAGTFEADPGTRLADHVYCTDKGACDTIGDGLPQAAADDPAPTRQVRD